MTESATLLVVEDDIHLLHGIRDILEIEGYEVLTAANGVDGLDLLQSLPKPPDLIISDIMMPRMNGYEFFDAVRKKNEWVDIPFVFLTAKGEKADIRLGKELGADDYVVKPMDPDDLLVIVRAKLKRHAQIRQRYDGQVSQIKREILTILNHEFRTPLTYMVAYSDMLSSDAETLTSQELRNFLQGINSGADRFRRLVENFIVLVELQTGEAAQNYAWRKQRFDDLRAVCERAVKSLQTLAMERGVVVRTDVPDHVPTIIGDHEYLYTTVAQLLENAIKFSDKPDSVVWLRVIPGDSDLRIVVEDQGRGIEEQYFEKIWEPFFQINRAQHEDQGAGAGLALVRGIVDMHGGTVDVQSTFGEGSTFTVTLPLATEEELSALKGD